MRRFFGCLLMLGVLAGCEAKMSSDTSSTISTPPAAEEEVVAISETVEESPAADATTDAAAADPQVTPAVFNVGDAAPKFANLAGVDDKKYGLDDFSEAKAVAVVFTCNNCPVAKAYEDRLNEYQKEYKDKGVQLVAINVNNVDGDRMPEMKTRATEKGFEFPYLYDPTQKVARDFNAEVTPHVFLLDSERKLAYVGPVDDNMDDASAAKPLLRQATDAVLAGKAPEVTQEKPLGCGIKYE
jgi:peroxiredoxin